MQDELRRILKQFYKFARQQDKFVSLFELGLAESYQVNVATAEPKEGGDEAHLWSQRPPCQPATWLSDWLESWLERLNEDEEVSRTKDGARHCYNFPDAWEPKRLQRETYWAGRLSPLQLQELPAYREPRQALAEDVASQDSGRPVRASAAAEASKASSRRKQVGEEMAACSRCAASPGLREQLRLIP